MKKSFRVFAVLAVLVIAACLFLLPGTAQAASTSDLTFTLNDAGDGYIVSDCDTYATGELVIPATYNGKPVTSIGEEAFFYCTRLTSITIPDSVTSIDYGAFSYCTGLTGITIPDSVTSIGVRVFYYCSSLTSITIPDSVTGIGECAFYNCLSLTSITIPDSVTSIGEWAFSYCTNLTSITIPDSVTSIGKWAFNGCTDLTSITIPDSVTSIDDSAFYHCTNLTSVIYCGTQAQWDSLSIGSDNEALTNAALQFHNYENGSCTACGFGNVLTFTLNDAGDGYIVSDCDTSATGELVIPATYKGKPVTAIGDYVFYGCESLTSITIPDSVTSIGKYAFSDCSGLTSITIPDSVTSIGKYAFSDCTGLTSITIPDGVTSIDNGVFFGCESLTSITIPDSVTSIGNSAFEFCSGLTSITIPDGVTSIGDSAFFECSSLTSITIPDSVTAIGGCVFDGCSRLTDITIPDGVTSIDFGTFSRCSRLTDITIPDSVTRIGGSAFISCFDLTSITIPDSVTSIGDDAFMYCICLTSITIPDSVTIIGDSAFSDCYGLTNVIYCGTQEQWDAIEIGNDNEDLTDATLQFHNYENGACTACGATQSPTDANLKFYRAKTTDPYGNFKLTGEIIAYLTAKKQAAYEDYYVVFSYTYLDNVVTFEATPSSSSNEYYAQFDCPVPAALMTTDIQATVYGVKDGVAYKGETITFTVRECVDAKLDMWINSTNDKQIKLFDTLVNMLEYGAQAQTRFGINTDNLATAGLPENYAARIKTTDPTLVAGTKPDESGMATTLSSLNLMLKEKINIYGNFKAASGIDVTEYVVKIVHTKADGSTATYEITDLQLMNSIYIYFECDDIAPSQMRDQLQITLYHNGVAVSATYIRSGETIVAGFAAALKDLGNAVMNYADCAKAAFS